MGMAILAMQMAAALALDWVLGEPRRFHPVAGIGALATWTEWRLRGDVVSAGANRLRGFLALLLVVGPPVALVTFLESLPGMDVVLGIACLYLALGHRSLHDHAMPVAEALGNGDEPTARRLASRMVSRDPDSMHVAGATAESVLENGSDAVFAALFWFGVAGAPGVVAYRVVNTLDAMWGYRNVRYESFGWAAARFDDLLNLLPARLTGLTYALCGSTGRALACWRRQGDSWESPNAGVVMAAGAGALEIRLGGPCRYAGEMRMRPWLGEGRAAEGGDIRRALALLRRSVIVWLAVAAVAGGAGVLWEGLV
jgi:adenosylcobinamide-phosphate synthase